MIRAALIGTGMVAGTHLAALRDAKDVKVVGIMGRNPQKTQGFAKNAAHEVGHEVQVFSDIGEITKSDKVDCVILVTPPDARLDIVRACVDARLPILMEKPIERTLPAAEQLVAMCEQASVPLGIVLQHRARNVSRLLRKAVHEGTIGQIVSAEIRVPWWRDQAYYDAPGRGTYARDGGGVMINQAIHTLDLALWILGPFASVQSLMKTTELHAMEAEDWAGALFVTRDGVVGSMTASTVAFPGSAESITLQGTKASAHLESGTLTINYLDGRTEAFGAAATTGGGADPMAFTHEWHQTILENFVSHITDQSPLIASGLSALEAHRVISAMEQSNANGQKVSLQG